MRVIVTMILSYFFFSILVVASKLLLGFCVYYDAKYRKSENAILWGLLSGFFEIAALVYIILQLVNRQQGLRCPRCGEFIAPGGICCPRCGFMLNIPTPEQLESYNRKRKLFLGLWIGSIVLFIIVMAIFIGFIAVGALDGINNHVFR